MSSDEYSNIDVGLPNLTFKNESEPDFFDFGTNEDYGLFEEAGDALDSPSQNTVQPSQIRSPFNTSTTISFNVSSNSSTSSIRTNESKKKNKSSKNDWTEMDEYLFHNGLELFGQNWGKISKFVSTKTPLQVKKFYNKWAETANVIQECGNFEIIPNENNDSVYLAQFEDPLGLIETATTTVVTSPHYEVEDKLNKKGKKRKPSTNLSNDLKGAGNYELLKVTDDWNIGSEVSISDVSSPSHSIIKNNNLSKDVINKSSKKPKYIKNKRLKKKVVSKNNKSKKKNKETTIHHTISHNVNLLENKTIKNITEGQLIHITKEEDECSDVDIEISDDDKPFGHEDKKENFIKIENEDEKPLIIEVKDENTIKTETKDEKPFEVKDEKPLKVEDEDIHITSVINNEVINEDDLVKQLEFTFKKPEEELTMNLDIITEEEKTVHFEYFDGKGVKTPERYIKIRNYLINFWINVKPKYVRKTAVRHGLKSCGDVNSIGKVHEYLEKIGAINFGCEESNYTDPLIVGSRQKEKAKIVLKKDKKLDRSDVSRMRKKKMESMAYDGGLTISHDESGAVIDTCHVSEPLRCKHSEKNIRQMQFNLHQCHDYGSEKNAPYSVAVHSFALVSFDIHAHTSRAEVMGLLGGYHDPEDRVVHVTLAVPTKSISTGIECDMCPLSQNEACIKIHESGVQVVGWYHSHPTFPPNPSGQDIATQYEMQKYFSIQNSPFLGIIISPFSPTSTNEASSIQCLVLDSRHNSDKTLNISDKTLPYKLKWEVSQEISGDLEDVGSTIRKVTEMNNDDNLSIVWKEEWRTLVTYWEKTLKSLEYHLPNHPNMTPFINRVKRHFLVAIKQVKS